LMIISMIGIARWSVPMKMASVSTTFGFDDYGIDRGIKVLIISMIIIWMMLLKESAS
jgi:hypothetical protein